MAKAQKGVSAEEIKDLSREGRAELVVRSLQMVQSPFPPPEFVECFERLSPGAADRILRMAEKQQDARLESDGFLTREAAKFQARGQVFAVLLCAAMLCFSFLFAKAGFPKIAATTMTTTILGVARLFLAAPLSQKKGADGQNSPKSRGGCAGGG